MKFLIVDTQHMFYRALHVTKGDAYTKGALSLHIMLSSLASVRRAFDVDHVVFCLEGRSWRRDFDIKYKAQRRAAIAEQTEKERDEFELYQEMFNDLFVYLKTRTNATVLQCGVAEADDLIARWVHLHPEDQHIILSSDKDFHQLLAHNVVQYDGVNKKYYTVDKTLAILSTGRIDEIVEIGNPEYTLFKHIIRGDVSDNIMKAYPGITEKSTKKRIGIKEAYEDKTKQGYAWNNFMQQKWTDHTGTDHLVKDCFVHNEVLIDLTRQPEDVLSAIDNLIVETVQSDDKNKIEIHFMKFCKKYALEKCMQNSKEFLPIFKKSYNQC